MRIKFYLRSYIYISAILLSTNVLLADTDSPQSSLTNPNNTRSSADSDTKTTDSIKSVKLPSSVVTTTSQLEEYQSGEMINESMIESNPSGNGDITSILRILPNVQFDNAQSKSSTPGEIDPANISISGGLYYQNNFQLDGFNMNNDLDPIGGGTAGTGGASQGLRGGISQGFNIDTSLLESIVVQDSNVSAAYGGFTGGVVEANIRKARTDGWHGGISYQYTGDNFTHYFIHESAEANFATSSNENYQPRFTKHLIKANAEGYITQNLGIIAAFSTTRSFIPLNGYSNVFRNYGTQKDDIREQKRISDNYYIKAHYNPTENFTLEANLGYIPQFNTYFSNITKDSFYTMQSGGWQAGLKGLWDTKVGLWTNTLGYSRLESSRKSDKNYWLSWRYSENDKNWAASGSNNNRYVSEGGISDVDQIQDTLNYKSDMSFDPIDVWQTRHTFRVGAELNYQNVAREITNNYYYGGSAANNNYVANLDNKPCQGDIFGLSLCSSAATLNSWGGQYIKQLNVIQAGSTELNNFMYGVYIEDDMGLDLWGYGKINARVGLRLDGDNYMDKHTLAPRFSLNYVTPVERAYQSTLIFGANRYYGRNLFSYRLYDSILAATKQYNRTSIDTTWTETDVSQNSGFKFNQLNVPYDDELMVGLSQNAGIFSAVLKYIHREGKDEIMRRQRNASSGNAPAIPGYSATYNFYTNDGKSRSDIVTLMISNAAPIDTFGVKHFYLLAFDWTDTKRTYNLLAADENYFDDKDIMYNGQVIKYRDRPVDNFALPYTLRLNTTHTFNIWRTKWLWNNFFRYRAGYERMVLVGLANVSQGRDYDTYSKMKINGAFTWDMRIGFEINVWRNNLLYMNLDIYNVLNTRNMTTTGAASGASNTLVYASSSAIPVYEVGRQFWLQVGYKF